MPERPAAGGGRWVSVAPERLERWLDAFAAQHGDTAWELDGQRAVVTGGDGTVAEIAVPFGALTPGPGAPDRRLIADALRDRTVGVLLARLGGYAAGVFDGPRLSASKVGSRPVHGRSAAGGRSQHRFARRREGQARVALEAAADAATAVLLPAADGLDAVVTGGDRRAVEAVLDDPRLARLRHLVSPTLLDVPDPRRDVLEGAYTLFRAVRIRIVDPQ